MIVFCNPITRKKRECQNYQISDKLIWVRKGIFTFAPSIANYPHAKFPGVVVFSEIYQGRLVDVFITATLKSVEIPIYSFIHLLLMALEN